jgi:hypothetical protein
VLAVLHESYTLTVVVAPTSKDREIVVAGGIVHAPDGEMAIVFSDITRAASLWEFNAEAMRDATIMHNALLRSLLKKHRGYEVVFIRYPAL